MTVFKTFWRVWNQNKLTVILFTMILLVFSASNMGTQETSTSFTAKRPDILVIDRDGSALAQDFTRYVEKFADQPVVEDSENARADALFYNDADLILTIPQNFGARFLAGEDAHIEVRKSTNYNAAYAEMLISRYWETAGIFRQSDRTETELIAAISETLTWESSVSLTTELDTTSLQKGAYFFNFASYSILACVIYIIAFVLSSFREQKIQKRTVISSMNLRRHNRILLLSNLLYSLILWLFYMLLSLLFVGRAMFSAHGAFFAVNAFVFTLCATTIAFFIGTLVQNKNAIGGVVNVVALGSSFLCGAFVPAEFLPEPVLKIAHLLPTYYYIHSNEALTAVEHFDRAALTSFFLNCGIQLAFAVLFLALTNFVSYKKRKIA